MPDIIAYTIGILLSLSIGLPFILFLGSPIILFVMVLMSTIYIYGNKIFRRFFARKNIFKILIADDDLSSILPLYIASKNLGFKISTANSEAEVRNQITSDHFDVIFMDYFMPEKTGVEILEQVNFYLSVNHFPPVVIYTGTPDLVNHESQKFKKKYNFLGVINKSTSYEHLLDTLLSLNSVPKSASKV